MKVGLYFQLDERRGSGQAQSALMLETLRILDEDYYKQFGWKQATIWAYEEPETSLHHSLEEEIAASLVAMTSDPKSRFQIIATTHSNLIVQYAGAAYYIARSSGTTECNKIETSEDLDKLWSDGLSQWHHPLLRYSRNPLFLVEGKFDFNYFETVQGIIPNGRAYRVSYLEHFDTGSTGGKDDLYTYLKSNLDAIRRRSKNAPIAIVLDWDAANQIPKYEKLLKGANAIVTAWKVADLNPELGDSFKGIERALGTKFVNDICNENSWGLVTNDGKFDIHPKNFGDFKKAAMAKMIKAPDVTQLSFIIKFFSKVAMAADAERTHTLV